MNWRSPRLLSAVRELPCTWPLRHHCIGDTQAAHSNQLRDGKGRSLKAHDFRIAALCHVAHRECDQGSSLDRASRIAAWDEAHRATIGLLFLRGYLTPTTPRLDL